MLKSYLHESNCIDRGKLVEEQDFQVFDKLQADTVKKFFEVRVLQSSAEEDKNERVEDGGRKRGKSLGCLLCLDVNIIGQHSEEKKKNPKKRWGRGPGEGCREY